MRHLVTTALVLCCANAASAQALRDHGWVDVDALRLQSINGAQTASAVVTLYQRQTPSSPWDLATLRQSVTYPSPAGLGVNLGGGVFVSRAVGFGIHVVAANYHASAMGTFNINLLNTTGTPPFSGLPSFSLSQPTAPLDRRDRSIDFRIVYRIPLRSNLEVRMFGGPTYFHVTDTRIQTISGSWAGVAAGQPTATITGFGYEDVTGSAWGANAGADVTVPLTRYLGVGGAVRFVHATISAPLPAALSDVVTLDSGNGNVKVDQVQFGGGLRLRF